MTALSNHPDYMAILQARDYIALIGVYQSLVRHNSSVPRWTEMHWSAYICSSLQVRWSAYRVRWMLNCLYAFVQAEVRWSAGAII